MAEKIVLYSYFRSSCSWRVRIALALKGLKYSYEAVHLLKDGGQQNKEEYKKINPMGFIPSLLIDGLVLTQSLPIMEYLEERNPEPALLPRDKAGRAKVRAISEVINSGMQPLQNLRVLGKVGDGKEEWARYFLTLGFDALEKMLEETAGQYCYGDEVTMADICLVPQIYGAKRFKVDMSKYPVVNRVVQALEKLPAFIEADAARQPDTPEDMRVP